MLAGEGENLLLSFAELSHLSLCLPLPKGSAAWLSQICNGEPMCTTKALGDQLQIPHQLNTTGLCSLQCCATRSMRYEVRNSF